MDRREDKAILAKLLEEGIKILIRKECKKIGSIRINIIASSLQIIKGLIKKIHIIAENINYKDLLFDKIELESNEVKITLKINSKELKFKNNMILKFKISLSENSLRKVLLSNKWDWIGSMISKELLNQDKLENITIKNDQILIKGIKEKLTISLLEKIEINAKKGKIYLENESCNKSIKIPLEDKIYIKNVNIKNNLLIISANSSISF